MQSGLLVVSMKKTEMLGKGDLQNDRNSVVILWYTEYSNISIDNEVNSMNLGTDIVAVKWCINLRRACAARVTVVCLSTPSRTTGYEAAYELYKRVQIYEGLNNKKTK